MGVNAAPVNRFASWLGAWILCTGLIACDPEVEGCLDYRALSVAIEADVACDDCCIYPTAEIRFIGARNLDGDLQVLTRADQLGLNGDSLRVVKLAFLLSDVSLELADGTLLPLEDTLSVRASAGAGAERGDYSLLRVAPFASQVQGIGELLQTQSVVALRATLGLPTELATLLPSLQPVSIPLGLAADSLATATDGLRSAVLRSVRAGESDTLESYVTPLASASLRFEFPDLVELPRSYNLAMTIALPVDGLAVLQPGLVPGQEWADALFRGARVAEVSVER